MSSGTVISTAVLSVTVTLKSAMPVLPCSSVPEHVTVVCPSGKVDPEAGALFDRAFPFSLSARLPPRHTTDWPVGGSDADRRELEETLDLVLWPAASGVEIGGRLVAGANGRITFRTASPEAATWEHLIGDALTNGAGLPVVDLGSRIGPANADRAELTNLAARHIHTLRGRLRAADALVTVNHAYRLSDQLRIGSVRRSN